MNTLEREVRLSYVVFLPRSRTQNLDSVCDRGIFNISEPYGWSSRVCFLIKTKDCTIKIYMRVWNECKPQATLLSEKKVTINPLLCCKNQEKSRTYSDIGVNVIFFAVFTDESTSQFINSSRNDLKPIVRFGEDRFQSSYLHFQIIQTSHGRL